MDILKDSDIIHLTSKKGDVLCEFLISSGFTECVKQSDHYHFHALHEIHTCVRGNMHILAEDKELVLNEGDVCFIPADTVHYVFADESSFRIGFRFGFEKTGKEGNIFSVLSSAFNAAKGGLIINESGIYNKYLKVAAENTTANMPEFMTSELLFMAIYELALKITGGNTLINNYKDKGEAIITEKIEEYLNRNYTKNIKLSDLSEHLNLGRRQTERVIKNLFGMTFTELISKKRLTVAKLLLRTTEIPIEQVVLLSGFEDKNYFYRKFSAAFNTTPGNFRK